MKDNYSNTVGKAVVPILSFICMSSVCAEELKPLETMEVIGHATLDELRLGLVPEQDTSADFRRSLAKLPGVSVIGNGGVTAIPQYRGLFGDRVSIQVDGAQIAGAGPNAMDSPLSHAVPKPASIVTVYRGIAPVSVGAETLGGAITVESDVQSRFAEQAAWHSNLSLHTRDGGETKHASGYFGFANKTFFVSANGIDQQQDSAEDGRGVVIPNSFYARHGYGADTGVRFGNHMISGTYQKIKTQDSGTPALAMDIEYIDANWYRLHYGFQGTGANNMQAELSLYGNQNEHGMNNFLSRPLANMMMARKNTVDSDARGFKGRVTFSADMGLFSSGMQWDENQHNSTINNPLMGSLKINNFNEIERTRQSVFVDWESEFGAISSKIGTRLTQIDSSAGEVSNSMAMMNPNVAAIVDRFNQADRASAYQFVDFSAHFSGDIDNQLAWQASLARKHRAPSYTELYVWLPLGISAGLADGRNYVGNLDLTEESANQIDLGLTYTASRMQVSPQLFYQSIDNYIVGEPSTDPLANMISTMMSGRDPLQWQNTDATLWGMDILFNGQLSPSLTIDMAATWVRAKRDDINQPLYRIAPATLSTSLNWQSENVLLSVESELVANQKQVSSLQDENPTAGYGLINLMLQYHVNEHIRVSLNVDNLFDKGYQSHLGGVNRVNSSDVMPGERLFSPGREVSATLTVAW